MSLHDYLMNFHHVVERIDNYGFAESIDITEERRAAKQAIIKSKITFVDGSVLHIKEYIDAKYTIQKVHYAYQYQGRDGKLIFRYDNARHRPDLGFSSHKHFSDGSIKESSIPNISDVVDEVIGHI